MPQDLIITPAAQQMILPNELPALPGPVWQKKYLPPIILRSAPDTAKHFIHFFTATIRNKNTRAAYGRAVGQFLAWLAQNGFDGELTDIEPDAVAGYIEVMVEMHSAPTAKQHLAAIRKLFDWLVVKGVLKINPATSVKGPSHSQTRGSTPFLTAKQTRQLLNAIDTDIITGLRDRALIGIMAYAFSRISAALALDVKDIFTIDRTLWLRLHEKGGKQHEMPCHHELAAYLDDYLEVSGLRAYPDNPLFPTATRHRQPRLQLGSDNRLRRRDALAMVKRRALKAGLDPKICNHSFRATGITNFLQNGGEIEAARKMAAHSSIKTTHVYDRRGDAVVIADVERIRF